MAPQQELLAPKSVKLPKKAARDLGVPVAQQKYRNYSNDEALAALGAMSTTQGKKGLGGGARTQTPPDHPDGDIEDVAAHHEGLARRGSGTLR